MTSDGFISLDKARSVARDQAKADLECFNKLGGDILDGCYLEAPGCWLFFRNRLLVVPEDANLGISWAYAVSKKGMFNMVEDYLGDNVLRLELLRKMSDYYLRKGW